jgi:hypothetical protein
MEMEAFQKNLAIYVLLERAIIAIVMAQALLVTTEKPGTCQSGLERDPLSLTLDIAPGTLELTCIGLYKLQNFYHDGESLRSSSNAFTGTLDAKHRHGSPEEDDTST